MNTYQRAARSPILTSLAISLVVLVAPQTNYTKQASDAPGTTKIVKIDSAADFEKEVLVYTDPVLVYWFTPYNPNTRRGCQDCLKPLQKLAQDSDLQQQNFKFVAANIRKVSFSDAETDTYSIFKNGLVAAVISGPNLKPLSISDGAERTIDEVKRDILDCTAPSTGKCFYIPVK